MILPNDLTDQLLVATVQSVEEAIINSLIAAERMEGINANKSFTLPQGLLLEVMRKYNRLNE